jgi:hypothetical protein
MAGAFQQSSFQYTGFQMDPVVIPPATDPQPGNVGKPRRHYYEIKGRIYLLSEWELEYLLHMLAEGEEPPKPKKGKAARIRAPKEWTPVPTENFDYSVIEELEVEAKNHNYPTMLSILERMRSTEDEDLEILLLYG